MKFWVQLSFVAIVICTRGLAQDTITLTNSASPGTTLGTLTSATGAPSQAAITTAASSGGVVGITISGAGTSGTATIQITGLANCVFSNATTAGDYVQISPLTNGDCYDSGISYPTAGQVIGRVLSTNGSAGTYQITLFSPDIRGMTGGAPGGSDTQVQYNSSGSFAGNSQLTFNSSTGALSAGQMITASSPTIDIRSFGAVIDGHTDIGPAVSAALASYTASRSGQSATILLPCGGTSAGCWWQNPLATSGGGAGNPGFKYILQGALNVGTTLMLPGATEFDGDAGAYGTQFQGTLAVGTVNGPQCNGSLASAITTTNSAVTITPTFSGTAGGSACTIANLPVNSAITMRGTEYQSGLSATRVTYGSLGYVTISGFTPRISPGANISISGCADSTYNSSPNYNVAVNVDYPNQTLSYFTTSTTAGSTTGCILQGFSDDRFETALVQCSNGVANAGYSCGTGQISFVNAHTYASYDLWAEAAMETPFNDGAGGTGLVMKKITVQNSLGAEFFDDAGIHETFEDDGFVAEADGRSVPFEADSVQNLTVHSSSFNSINTGWSGCSGGVCPEVSYPYGFHCSAIPPSLSPYQEVTCTAQSKIDNMSQIRGGIKVDTNDFSFSGSINYAQAPELDRVICEETVWGCITFDTRYGVSGPINIKDSYSQDFVLGNLDQAFLAAEDYGGAEYVFDTNTYEQNPFLVSKYWTAPSAKTVGNLYNQQNYPSAGGSFDDNGVHWGEELASGFTGFESVPFGTLPITQSPISWVGLCGGCSITAVQDPTGGQNGANIASTSTSPQQFTIGTDDISTYAGDQIIFMDWLRPGTGAIILSDWRGNLPFELTTNGTDSFYSSCYGGIGTNTACANGAGLLMGNAEWSPFVGVATFATGESANHQISFLLESGATGNGTIQNIGQQSFCPQWAFVPGPNNPAYTGVSTFDVQLARVYNYHGCAPGGVSAGLVATNQGISTPSMTIQGAPSGSYAKADGTGYGTPSGTPDTAVTVGTSAISANSCTSVSTVTMTGLTTSMTANFTPSSDVSTVTGWGPSSSGQLYFIAWPSASNTLSYYVCNPTGASIAPGSGTTWNVSAK